jgi:hypothetical protein
MVNTKSAKFLLVSSDLNLALGPQERHRSIAFRSWGRKKPHYLCGAASLMFNIVGLSKNVTNYKNLTFTPIRFIKN